MMSLTVKPKARSTKMRLMSPSLQPWSPHGSYESIIAASEPWNPHKAHESILMAPEPWIPYEAHESIIVTSEPWGPPKAHEPFVAATKPWSPREVMSLLQAWSHGVPVIEHNSLHSPGKGEMVL